MFSIENRNTRRYLPYCRTALLIIFCLIVATGCSRQESTAIRFGLSTAPVTLDPRFATDAVSYRITRLLYRSLVDFDAGYKPVPALARWKQNKPLNYRFMLGDEGRLFQDGSRLTARDVKATYDFILDPENASPHRGSLANIDSIRIVDENTVEFLLGKPDPLFPGRLVIGILPHALIQSGHPFNDQPVGSGPLRFRAWPEEGRLVLERIRDNQEVAFIAVADPTVRVLKLLRGELDLFQGDIPPEMTGWLQEQSEIRIEKGKGTTFSYIGFNMEDPVVASHAVRLAVAMAIDRRAIIDHVMGGAARPAAAMLPPDHWAGASALDGIPHDPALARQLMEQAGFGKDRPLRLVYKTSNNPFRIRLATIIQHQLSRVGIDVEIRSYDWGTFYGDIKAGRFQMYSLSWVGLKMPDIFRYVFHSEALPPQGANRGRFVSARADWLIETAENERVLEKQAALYRELQALLLAELPYIPLWYEDNVLAARNNIENYILAPDGNYDELIRVEKRLTDDNRQAAN